MLPILGTHDRDQSLLVTVAWVSIADIATVLAVPFVLSTGGFGRALTGAVLVVAGAALAGIVIAYLSRQKRVEQLRDASHHLAWALDLRVWLVVLFTLAWIAERFDTSVLIAGFACGIVISAVGQPRRVADQLIGLGEGFFVPLFFVVLGARIDLRALVHSGDEPPLVRGAGDRDDRRPRGRGDDHPPAVHERPAGRGRDSGVPSAIASLGLAANVLEPGQAAAIVGAAVVSLAATSIGAIRLGLNPRINPRAPDAAE